MSNTLMGTLQQAIRNTFGCANDFNGDLHVLCDYWGIPMVPISGRTIDVSRKYDASITDATSALNYLLYNPTIAVPALGLNFVNNETLDPRITFSRTSNATQFDSSGNLVYAPHNLLTFSEQFDNAAWGKNAITIGANATAAPDGTVTADKIQETAVTNFFAISSNPSGSYSTAYTHSIYAKAGERTSMQVSFTVSVAAATFNLSNGTVTSSSGSSLISASIQSVGNGWYRCITRLTTVASGANPLFHIVGTVNDAGSTTFAGVAGNGIFIWGAQLNVGTLQPYYPTTVKNALGYTQEFDNAAWTKSNSFVQTNLLVQSENMFEDGTGTLNWIFPVGVITSNTQVAPDGTTTADTLTTTGGAQSIYQSATVLASTTYTFSVYARLGTMLASDYKIAVYNNTAPGFIAADVVPSQTPTATGWTRIQYSFATPVGCTSVRVYPFRNSAGISSCTVFLWGAQLVQGSTAGDYVRTNATARAVMYPAPDGSVTGDKLVESVTGATSHLAFQGATITAGLQCTFSVYLKKGERNFARIVLGNAASPFQGVTGAVDLVAGTVVLSTQASPTNASAQIQSVGNDWYRVAVSGIFGAGTTVNSIIYTAATSATINYVGDGTSGIFIWGAQLSDSASLDPYVYNPVAAPTAAAYYGPRFDYDPSTLAARGLLIEEQRTNSIRNNSMVGAVAGTPGTLPTNWIVSGQGLTTNVIGTGTSAGITYVDLQITGTPTGSPYVLSFESSAISAAASQTWTESAWFALVGGNLTNVGTINLRMRVYDSGSVFLGQSDSAALTLTSSLVRNSHNYPSLPALTAFIEPALRVGLTAGQAVNFTIRIGLPQLELGAFATSVIPTTTAAATRTADVATMVGANFGNWYNQNAGTLYAEAATLEIGSASGGAFVLNVSDGTGSNLHRIFRQSDAQAVMQTLVGGSAQTTFGFGATWTDTQPRKLTYAYALNDFAGAVNAGAVQTDTSGLLPVGSVMDIGCVGGGTQLNGWVRRIAYYPTRLSNAQLQAVTA